MPVIFNKKVDADTRLGIWEITEDYDTLRQSINLADWEMERLNSFKNHNRKLEWLSVRCLVVELTKPGTRILYTADRKPYLHDNSFNISISHSHKLTSVLLSKTLQVGLDLEYMSHRISRVQHKFINEHENITDNEEDRKYHLYIHWCAKEALYKICDKQDINFKTNLTIKPFSPEKKGNIKGILNNVLQNTEFDLSYFCMDNYILVWVNKHF